MLSCFRVPLLNLDNWPCVLGHIMKVILPRYKYYKNKKKKVLDYMKDIDA